MTLSLKGPFEKPRGWAVWALWGILLAPVVVGVASNILDITGYDVRPPSPRTKSAFPSTSPCPYTLIHIS